MQNSIQFDLEMSRKRFQLLLGMPSPLTKLNETADLLNVDPIEDFSVKIQASCRHSDAILDDLGTIFMCCE